MKMKRNNLKFMLLIFSIISIQLVFSQETFERLPDEETDKSKTELASKVANAYFESVKNGKYYDFEDEAVKEFKDQMTPEVQKQTYTQLKEQFGDFESLAYSETWITKDNIDLQVIRFKGKFEKSEDLLEIRVVLNASNKITGLWIKPWRDNLNKI